VIIRDNAYHYLRSLMFSDLELWPF